MGTFPRFRRFYVPTRCLALPTTRCQMYFLPIDQWHQKTLVCCSIASKCREWMNDWHLFFEISKSSSINRNSLAAKPTGKILLTQEKQVKNLYHFGIFDFSFRSFQRIIRGKNSRDNAFAQRANWWNLRKKENNVRRYVRCLRTTCHLMDLRQKMREPLSLLFLLTPTDWLVKWCENLSSRVIRFLTPSLRIFAIFTPFLS